ncbi:expressed unknown protein [Seminavis robusta]|uniref:Uncharacterized protein n=1 Tax=Seminavis robusta TaxID=568900 RepID=A0A9N8DAF6_9STRA|nr:expressed unknown protein [Seminavis robusta]|eukprot:Sro57_g033220.1 n/a (393) ;mRNA; r:35623-36893
MIGSARQFNKKNNDDGNNADGDPMKLLAMQMASEMSFGTLEQLQATVIPFPDIDDRLRTLELEREQEEDEVEEDYQDIKWLLNTTWGDDGIAKLQRFIGFVKRDRDIELQKDLKSTQKPASRADVIDMAMEMKEETRKEELCKQERRSHRRSASIEYRSSSTTLDKPRVGHRKSSSQGANFFASQNANSGMASFGHHNNNFSFGVGSTFGPSGFPFVAHPNPNNATAPLGASVGGGANGGAPSNSASSFRRGAPSGNRRLSFKHLDIADIRAHYGIKRVQDRWVDGLGNLSCVDLWAILRELKTKEFAQHASFVTHTRDGNSAHPIIVGKTKKLQAIELIRWYLVYGPERKRLGFLPANPNERLEPTNMYPPPRDYATSWGWNASMYQGYVI